MRKSKPRLAAVVVLVVLVVGATVTSCEGSSTTYDWFGTYSGRLGCPTVGGSITHGNPQNALWQFNSWSRGPPPHVHCVADPLGSGRAVQAFAIPDTDRIGNASPRGDSFSNYPLEAGMDKYISIPMYTPATTSAPGAGNIGLPSNCGSSGPTFFLFSQLEWPGERPPPALGIGCTNSGGTVRWAIGCCDTRGRVVWKGPPIDNAWHDLILHLHFESAPGGSNGELQVWRDGVRQTLANGQTTMSGLHFLPKGYSFTVFSLDSYRSDVGCSRYGFMCGTYTLYHGAAAIGSSYASVASTLSNGSHGP
jgi:hypothetical protein